MCAGEAKRNGTASSSPACGSITPRLSAGCSLVVCRGARQPTAACVRACSGVSRSSWSKLIIIRANRFRSSGTHGRRSCRPGRNLTPLAADLPLASTASRDLRLSARAVGTLGSRSARLFRPAARFGARSTCLHCVASRHHMMHIAGGSLRQLLLLLAAVVRSVGRCVAVRLHWPSYVSS